MSENLRLLRFYFWLLALFTVGRWGLSLGGADYSKTHQVFSLVILALVASAHHAGLLRALRGIGIGRAIGLGATIGVVTQIVILVSTAVSYGLGMHTFFNSPQALNQPDVAAVPFAEAMVGRLFGLVVNTVLNSIAAAIGYAMGGALPRTDA